ncbi:hypothetical protein L3Q67_07475 [Saccharothrix sp. AJ9571]|nr:hypothetical protein L3Q67_07475 [Saccharothrix sp. AJ9571]
MKYFQILLGTKLADTPGTQLAVDLGALVLVIAILLLGGVSNPLAWILLPGGLLIVAIVRTVIVARRNTP